MDKQGFRAKSPATLAALVMGACFFVTLAVTALTQDAERIASIWPENAIVLSLLLMLERHRWPLIVVAAISGYFAANLALGDGPFQAMVLALANGAEISLGAYFMDRFFGKKRARMSREWLIRLSVWAGLVSCSVSATIASIILSTSALRFADVWTTYFPAHLIGIVTLTPVIVALSQRRKGRVNDNFGGTLPQIGLLTMAVTGGMFAQSTLPVMFLIFPVLIFAAFRAGIAGAAASLFIFTLVATGLTLNDYGPIMLISASEYVRILFLQGLILVATFTVMPVGFALADRRAALDRAKASATEANNANQAKSSFLANMSHEIRTPLTGVLGSAELLGNSELNDTQRRQVGLIHQSATSLLRLLNDILDLSKVEAGQMQIVDQPMVLEASISDCIDLVRQAGEAKGLTLVAKIDPELPPNIVADNLRFRQIMLNLLGNAIKFTKAGTITIRADMAGEGQLIVRVEDEGVGISSAKLKTLFVDFSQADNDTAHQYGGTGLGLSISRKLARLMGGNLRIESTVGAGTNVILELPLVAAAAEPAAPVLPAAPNTPAKRLNILLVDDLDINREVIGAMLECLGQNYITAGNGVEAIAALKNAIAQGTKPGLVLMDVRMPVMDGLLATRKIRQIDACRNLPIIGLTASAFAEDIAECRAAGMDDVTAKPATMASLAAALAFAACARTFGDLTADGVRLPTALQERYHERKTQSLQRLNVLIGRGSLEGASLQEVAELAHKLAGSAGMFGEADFGDLACELELAAEAVIGAGPAASGKDLIVTAFNKLEIAA